MKIVGTAIITDAEGRVLIGQRPEGKALPGLWEFPGGKQEDGETVEQCIVREIKEELDVDCLVGDFLMETTKSYPHGDFRLMFYRAAIKNAERPANLVHQQLRWVRPEDLEQYPFPPADVEIIKYLQKAAKQAV